MDNTINCQVCNLNCEITIEEVNDHIEITGNKCGRGHQFALKHLDESEQVVAGRCLLLGGQMGRLPVVTSKKIPGHLMNQALKIIQHTSIKAPVTRGQIIIENILDTGADVVAQRKAL